MAVKFYEQLLGTLVKKSCKLRLRLKKFRSLKSAWMVIKAQLYKKAWSLVD